MQEVEDGGGLVEWSVVVELLDFGGDAYYRSIYLIESGFSVVIGLPPAVMGCKG